MTNLSQVTIVFDEWASGLLVACTQPRVVAATGVATGVAALVAQEMDVHSGSIVGYKVRFDKQSSGAMLRGFLSNDLFLQQYAGLSTVEVRMFYYYSMRLASNNSSQACIMTDRAHERTTRTTIPTSSLPFSRNLILASWWRGDSTTE